MSRTVFIDSSAVYALADRSDQNHDRAKTILGEIVERRDAILTHDYILVESVALLQRRLGSRVAIDFLDNALQFFEIVWVDRTIHEEAFDQFRRSPRRHLSFVDRVSFIVMTSRSVATAFAFDDDFTREGFDLL